MDRLEKPDNSSLELLRNVLKGVLVLEPDKSKQTFANLKNGLKKAEAQKLIPRGMQELVRKETSSLLMETQENVMKEERKTSNIYKYIFFLMILSVFTGVGCFYFLYQSNLVNIFSNKEEYVFDRYEIEYALCSTADTENVIRYTRRLPEFELSAFVCYFHSNKNFYSDIASPTYFIDVGCDGVTDEFQEGEGRSIYRGESGYNTVFNQADKKFVELDDRYHQFIANNPIPDEIAKKLEEIRADKERRKRFLGN